MLTCSVVVATMVSERERSQTVIELRVPLTLLTASRIYMHFR